MKISPTPSKDQQLDTTKILEESSTLLNIPHNSLESINFNDVWKRARIKLKVIFFLRSLIKQKKFENKRNSFISSKTIKSDLVLNKKETENRMPFFMLHPEDKIKIFWNFYMGVLLVYTAIFMPYVLSFIDTRNGDAWFCIDLLLDFSFCIDVIVNLCSAYYRNDGVLVCSRKVIFITYLKSWMILDVVSCIPFSLFDGGEDQNSATYENDYRNILKLLRLPKLYRVFRIFKVFKAVSGYKQGQLSEKIQDFFSLRQSGIRLLTSCCTIIVSLHITACFWHYLSKIQGFSPTTWVAQAGLIDSDDSTRYITSLYWAATTFATVGYGDISANTSMERMFSVCWMIYSVYYFSFVIGSLTSMLETVNVKSTFLRNKIAIMEDFAKDARLSKELLNKLKVALKYANKKSLIHSQEKNSILSELPLQLKYEVSLAMYGKACSKINYLQDKDKVIITGIVPFLHPVCVEAEESVYLKGEHVEGIYFIIRGTANYVMNKSKKFLKVIDCGDFFGDIEVTLHITRKYTVQALNRLDLLFMDMNVIQSFSEQYVDEWETFRQKSLEKHYELIRIICEIKEKEILGDKFDARKFKINVDGRILKMKNLTMKQMKHASRLRVNIQTIHKKMENMCTRLYNLQNNIGFIKKKYLYARRRNSLSVTPRTYNDSQDTISETHD
jgi:hypothetical protein